MNNSDKNSGFVDKMVNSLKEIPLLHFITKPKLKKVDKIHYKKTDDENEDDLGFEVTEDVIEELDFEMDEITETNDNEDISPVLGPRISQANNDIDIVSIIDKISKRDKELGKKMQATPDKDSPIKETILLSKKGDSKVLAEKEREKYINDMIAKELKLLKEQEHKKEVIKMAARFYKAALQATKDELSMAKILLLKKRSLLDPTKQDFPILLEAIDSALYKIDYEISKSHGEFGTIQSVYEKKVVKF